MTRFVNKRYIPDDRYQAFLRGEPITLFDGPRRKYQPYTDAHRDTVLLPKSLMGSGCMGIRAHARGRHGTGHIIFVLHDTTRERLDSIRESIRKVAA